MEQVRYQAIRFRVQAFMQMTNTQLNQMLNLHGSSCCRDPPLYEGKVDEDVELWIFTEDYYSNRRDKINAESSDFVEEITGNLGKSVQNWVRTIFAIECAAAEVPKTWALFKERLRQRYKSLDFEYNLRERMFELKQTGTTHEYMAKFQDLHSQAEQTSRILISVSTSNMAFVRRLLLRSRKKVPRRWMRRSRSPQILSLRIFPVSQ